MVALLRAFGEREGKDWVETFIDYEDVFMPRVMLESRITAKGMIAGTRSRFGKREEWKPYQDGMRSQFKARGRPLREWRQTTRHSGAQDNRVLVGSKGSQERKAMYPTR